MTALEPRNGWHWREWLAEGAGSAIVLFAVVTAKDLAFRAGPPLSDLRWSIAIIAVVAGLAVGIVALSTLGRRSGAHLNPALTMGLWLQRTVSHADLVGYWVAQLAGGVLGVALARVWGPTVPRAAVDWALLKPAPWIGELTAAGVECAATGIQLAVVFALLSSRRCHRWTPPTAAAMLTAGIVVLGPVSGGAFNPVRGLAPDVLAGAYPAVWIYIAGPLLGAALAAGGFAALRRRPVTGKLRHDPAIFSYMRYDLHLLEDKIADAGSTPFVNATTAQRADDAPGGRVTIDEGVCASRHLCVRQGRPPVGELSRRRLWPDACLPAVRGRWMHHGY